MSLRVWLPLNGDLTNNGLSDVTVTNNGATVDNAGKIGKCYNFTSTYIEYDNPLPATCTQFSICAWVNLISGYTANCGLHIASFNTSYGRICVSKDGQAVRVLLNDGTTNYAGGSNALASSLTAGVWNHYVVTFDNGIVRIYINGQLDAKRTATITYAKLTSAKARTGTYATENSKGYANDLRIYDHALSPKEVKLLSQGLVCHYKLSDWLDGINPNRLGLFPKSYSPINYCAYQLSMTENLIAGETYTLQLWDVDVSHSEKTEAQLGIWIFWGGGSVMLGSWAGPSYFTNGHADHLVKTFTITASQASGSGATNAWFNMYNSVGYVAGTMNMRIGKWKLEKGSVATPYCHTIEEMGGVDTLVYDSSGYNNHSTLNLSTPASSDSPRNLTSTLFGAQNTPKSTFINTSLLSSLTNCTVCWWEKPITTANMLIFSNSNSSTKYIGAGSTSRDFYDSDIGTSGISFYRDGVLCTTTYSGNNVNHGGTKHIQNEWHHYALSGINLSSWAQFYINTYNSYPTQSYLSDIRLYATALSQEDIQQLYNTPVSVANTGAMMTQGEFVEGRR